MNQSLPEPSQNNQRQIDDNILQSFQNCSSSCKEWIIEHDNLVQKACYEERSFDLLIDEIKNYSDSVQNRRMLYKKIEDRWNGKNTFGAIVLDDGSFAVFDAEHF